MTFPKKSFAALDWVNIFMADVKDGVGIYLSVYLLSEHYWKQGQIGLVMSLPFIIGIIIQPGIGALIDQTRFKRHLLVIGSAVIALSCLIVIQWPSFWPIISAQALVGIFQTIYPPTVTAITLGIVGHKNLDRRIGRNESLNHTGNMIAAFINIVMAIYISYTGIFYFCILQCALIIFAILSIKEKDIDHNLARSALADTGSINISELKALFSKRNVLMFVIAMFLFNLANGTMLPLMGQKISLNDKENAAIYLSVCIIIAQAVMIIVASWAGRKADKGRKKLFLLSFLILPIRPLLCSLTDDPYWITSLQIFDGLAAGIYGVVYILMIADLSKGTGHFNLLQGVVFTSMGLGAATSSIVGGYIVENFGYNIGFQFIAILSIFAGIFFMLFVKETKREQITDVAYSLSNN